MESLEFASELKKFPLAGGNWRRELVSFAGESLLYEYQVRGATYLAYWCDRDDTYDRWMFVQVNELDVLRLIGREVRLESLAPRGGLGSHVFFLDDELEGNGGKSYLCSIDEIPEIYCPLPNTDLQIGNLSP